MDQKKSIVPQPTTSWAKIIIRIAFRVVVVLSIAYAAHLLMNWVIVKAEALGPSIGPQMMLGFVLLVLVAYALLIAVPFVPGIEIGLSLLVIRGPDVAFVVYLATVAGLMIAFCVGRFVPYSWLHRLFEDLHLKAASRMIERVAPLDRRERLELLRTGLPRWARPFAVDGRYLMLAGIINLPGNALLGGGGGICMVAGLSRLFGTTATAITIAIAVAPVPLAIWFFDLEISRWLG